jgi:CRP-like cAMP-binding protein
MVQSRMTEIRAALSGNELFGVLSGDQLDRVIGRGVTATFPGRRVVFQKNEPGDSLMVVLNGRIKISTMSMDGREAVLNFILPGGVLGEIALLDGGVRTADATASEPTEVFVLRRRDLIPLLREQPDIAVQLIEVLCRKLRGTTEQVEASMFSNTPSRMARALLRLAASHGHRQGASGVRIEVKLSQRDLGGYVGLARENVNRQLSAWRDEGLVSVEQGYITLLDPTRLQAIAEQAA